VSTEQTPGGHTHTDACYQRGYSTIVIGQPFCEREVSDKADRLLDGFIVAMQDLSTDELLEIAEYRHRVSPDGWMSQCIFQYVDVWR
jgi:hypothetical protein